MVITKFVYRRSWQANSINICNRKYLNTMYDEFKDLNKRVDLQIDQAVILRLQKYINSNLFAEKDNIEHSSYWRHHSDKIYTTTTSNNVRMVGQSGFYVPSKESLLQQFHRKAQTVLFSPLRAIRWLIKKIKNKKILPQHMSYFQAFDSVMSGAEISFPIISKFRINHKTLGELPNVFKNSDSIKAHYHTWSGYHASPIIIKHYYQQNILRRFMESESIKTVLEIGGGNGNFSSILYHEWAPVRVILIDLPQTLTTAIPFLSNQFPHAKILMPHEVEAHGLSGSFDFAFLTVQQTSVLMDNSIDLVTNVDSFQEMTQEQIQNYFKLTQRVCRNSGFFFSSNRVEKIPYGENPFTVEQSDLPNKSAEFPWNLKNKDLVNEISSLERLVQLDATSIRLQQIVK